MDVEVIHLGVMAETMEVVKMFKDTWEKRVKALYWYFRNINPSHKLYILK